MPMLWYWAVVEANTCSVPQAEVDLEPARAENKARLSVSNGGGEGAEAAEATERERKERVGLGWTGHREGGQVMGRTSGREEGLQKQSPSCLTPHPRLPTTPSIILSQLIILNKKVQIYLFTTVIKTITCITNNK